MKSDKFNHMIEETDINENKLLAKIKAAFRNLSQEALEHAFILFYTLKDPGTPLWCRTVILGALGYFISMIDGIPDLTPVLGYTDDITVMAAAVATLAAHITPEVKQKAKDKTDTILAKKYQKQAE